MSGAEEKGGGTPPPYFLQTIPDQPLRRGPGAPKGNRNAVKHGRRTAEMRALRAEVRFAVQNAKALAAAVWNPEALAAAAVVRRKEVPSEEKDDAKQSQIV